MGEVVNLDVVTTLDLTPERVLAGAAGQLASALVIGRWPSGKLYFASSIADAAEIVWLLELAKKQMLEASDPE